MSREVAIAALAVVAIAVGLSHPAMLRLTGVETTRSAATLGRADYMPTGSFLKPAIHALPPGVRGLTGLRAAIRARG